MDLFSLVAKITLDSSEYDKGIQDAGKNAAGLGEKLKTGLSTAAKIGTAAVSAASAAVVALTKQSIDGYADYEQLVGGVETLFKDSANIVQEYAANAYKTAGLSANEYMEAVTSFSASLLQSLGGDTAKAAKIGDMAISDMADNANKMGTSMESIQNAYQGFAKQNYTMLDNLKLGYGGTKSEMERLLEDATKLSGIEYDIESLSDVYEAIHVVQDELGITGTTAEEASKTISGSLSSMKSAWGNLVTGLGDDTADITKLIDNFVESVVTVGENIIPRVEKILDGLGEMITVAADKLVPIVVDTIVNSLPKIIESGVKLVVTLVTGLIQAIPKLVKAIPDILRAIINGFVAGWPAIKQAGVDLIQAAKDGFMSAVNAAKTWGKDLINNFVEGIKSKIQSIKNAVSNVAQTVKNFIGFSEPKYGPLSDFHTYAPDMMDLFIQGIENKKRDLINEVNSVARDIDFGVHTIDFSSSGIGMSSAATINSINNVAQTTASRGGDLIIPVTLPDGTEVARAWLSDWINVARSNGTPIANAAI